ncbi:MAG: DUF308 domain-containing protein [Clostridiales bacterium]|nr:DUF308 domain-containing protein [Clostridiales bacterium]
MKKVNQYVGNLVTCIVEIVIGVLLLINPIGFTTAILTILGIALAILGIVSVVKYFRTDPMEAAAESGLATGILLILIGCFLAFKSQWFIVTFPVLTALYGVMTLLVGVCKVQWAVDMLRTKQKYWYVAILTALLTVVFAAVILLDPFATTAVLWTFIAVTLIVEAIADIVTFILGKISAGKEKQGGAPSGIWIKAEGFYGIRVNKTGKIRA